MYSDIKKIGSQSFTYWFGVMAAKIAGFLLIPVYTRYLTPADYGTIELLSITTDIAALIFGMQIGQGLFKFYHECETQEEKNRLVSTTLISMVALGIFMAIGFNIFAKPITLLIFGSLDYLSYVRFFSTVYFLNLVVEIPFSLLRIKKEARLFTIVNFLNFIAMLVLNVFFIVVMGWGI